MPTYHLIGAYRAVAETPRPHIHFIAVGTAEIGVDDFVSTKAWTVNDLQNPEPELGFVIGPVGVTVAAEVGVVPCHECGELVVRVFPAELAARLPECEID